MTDTNTRDLQGLYVTSEVETRTGVPATTLRQWERRYGIPRPVRNASGYRLYSPLDLSRIEFMLRQLGEGITISRAAELAREHFGAAQPDEDLGGGAAAGHLHERASALTRALLQPDHARAGELLAQAHAQMPVELVLIGLLQPSLAEIGELWERGEITVAHEHQASAFIRARVAALMDLAGPGAGASSFGPTVVAACGPQEHHEIGLMMVATVLRRAGARVHYMGANTPLADLAVYARSVGAQAVLLSVNSHAALAALQAQLADLRDLGAPLYLGGSLLNHTPQLAAQLGGVYCGPDAVQAARQMVAQLSAPRS